MTTLRAPIAFLRATGTCLIVSCVFAILPLFTGSSGYLLTQFEAIGALMLVAIGLNIVTGFAGQLTLGPSAVFAIGAFCAIVFANHYPRSASLLTVCLVGVVSAGIAGIIIGLPALRIGGFYLALVTLFVAAAVPTIAGAWSVTGANSGISLVSNIDFVQATHGMALYEITVLVVAAALVGSALLHRSRLGRRMLVLKSSEELAASLGCSTYNLKVLAFLISAVAAGLGGGIYVYSQQYMSASSADVETSIYLLAACVIGGLGSGAGPAIGVALVYGLQDFLGFQQYTDLVFGGLLAIVALSAPEGLLGSGKELWERWKGRGARVDADSTGAPPAMTQAEVQAFLGHEDDAETVLGVHDLRRSFGGVTAVDDVSLTVRPGSVHGLIGSNGSGKTTLLNLISGFYRPNSGHVEISGTPLSAGKPQAGVKVGLARSFQTPKLVDADTVLGNVRPLRRTAGGTTKEAETVTGALRLLGLESLADAKVKTLPHGTRRLVEVARAIALKPKFILLDEPAAGLSSGELDVLRRAIGAIADAGVGVLLVEHNVPLVAELADEITVMHLGKAIAQGAPAEVLHDQQVANAFLGTTVTYQPEATQ